jgi:hypothetical protein
VTSDAEGAVSLYREFSPEPDGGRLYPPRAADQLTAMSAGIELKKLNPLAVEEMREIGIDTSSAPSCRKAS